MTEPHCLVNTDPEEEELSFFRDNRWQLGRIVSAAVSFPGLLDDDPYTVVLRDDAGTRMLVSGGPSDRVGGGQRTVLQILAEAGFAAEVAVAIRSHDFVRMSRTPDGTTVLEQATGLPEPVVWPHHLRPPRDFRCGIEPAHPQRLRTASTNFEPSRSRGESQ
jgi:hypothetical protein